jgi:hypothetical protein
MMKLCSYLRSGDTYQLTMSEIEPPQSRQLPVLVVADGEVEWHLGRFYELIDVKSYGAPSIGRVFIANKAIMI